MAITTTEVSLFGQSRSRPLLQILNGNIPARPDTLREVFPCHDVDGKPLLSGMLCSRKTIGGVLALVPGVVSGATEVYVALSDQNEPKNRALYGNSVEVISLRNSGLKFLTGWFDYDAEGSFTAGAALTGYVDTNAKAGQLKIPTTGDLILARVAPEAVLNVVSAADWPYPQDNSASDGRAVHVIASNTGVLAL